MKGMGFAALGLALVGFFFWLIGWVCFTFLISSIDSLARTIGSVCNFLGNLLQYISIFVAAIGLIIGGSKSAAAAD